MLKGFRDFIVRGNVVDLAIAVIMGAAFTSVVNSVSANLINPLIAAVGGKPNLSYLVLHIHGGEITYGKLLTDVISFLINASVVYFMIVLPMHSLMQRLNPPAPAEPTTKQCPECLSDIPLAAKRCAHCTQPVA